MGTSSLMRFVVVPDIKERTSYLFGMGCFLSQEAQPLEPVGKQLGLDVVRCEISPSGALFKLATGSILDFSGETIVNAANREGLGGGGVDGAINRAGGKRMVEARKSWKPVSLNVRIPEGTARSTKAFGSLKCNWVIHTVGPDFRQTDQADADALLAQAYQSALKEARNNNNGGRTIAFSLISAGVYRGSKSLDHVLDLGVKALIQICQSGESVFLVAFTREELDALQKVFSSNFGGTTTPALSML